MLKIDTQKFPRMRLEFGIVSPARWAAYCAWVGVAMATVLLMDCLTWHWTEPRLEAWWQAQETWFLVMTWSFSCGAWRVSGPCFFLGFIVVVSMRVLVCLIRVADYYRADVGRHF